VGRPGSALDNAVIESWHSTLEWELRRVEHFATEATARAKVAAWIEDYNTTRRHSSRGMLSPIATSGRWQQERRLNHVSRFSRLQGCAGAPGTEDGWTITHERSRHAADGR